LGLPDLEDLFQLSPKRPMQQRLKQVLGLTLGFALLRA
jgi:hypothetical protein